MKEVKKTKDSQDRSGPVEHAEAVPTAYDGLQRLHESRAMALLSSC